MSSLISTVGLWRAKEWFSLPGYIRYQMASRAGCQARRSLKKKKMLCEHRLKIWGRQ